MAVCTISPSNEWPITPGDVQEATEVLKEGQLFITSLPNGFIPCSNRGELGLYYRDTRFLDCFEIFLEETEPILLSSTTRDSHFAQIELTNKEIIKDHIHLPLQTLHLRLFRVLEDAMYQRLRIINFSSCAVELGLRMHFRADFRDVFEVRGIPREKRGELLPSFEIDDGFVLAYRGLDDIERYTEIRFSPAPDKVHLRSGCGSALFRLVLPPKKKVYVYQQITPIVEEKKRHYRAAGGKIMISFSRAAESQAKSYARWKRECTFFQSDNTLLNQMLERGITDLRALSTHYPKWGTIIEAGIPWYAVPFGRDALITSWQTLIVNPEIARNSLYFLARLQGKKDDPWRDEKPGKILHEIRWGEMASCGEIPHTPYYGSVDSTLWFIILMGELVRWTGNRSIAEELSGALDMAMLWCEKYGDLDGDGYIEYRRESARGLTNQGWKDSWDSLVDRNGVIPKGPIALVEVQGYYYQALKEGAYLYRLLGREEDARKCEQKAAQLQQQFIRDFWLPEEENLAYALDGEKHPIPTTVSNPGHCLFTGILPPELAHKVAKRLFQPDMYSGWGIRTMSNQEVAYNPMSYHNGSVWPHDNAIIAKGLRRYNYLNLLERLATGLYQAALSFPYYRLPELFCGFTRRGTSGPVHYPIACDPQAWAVGAVYQILHCLLGITSTGEGVFISKPMLPEWINELYVRNMAVGRGKVDLEFTRKEGKTYCNVIDIKGPVRIIFEP